MSTEETATQQVNPISQAVTAAVEQINNDPKAADAQFSARSSLKDGLLADINIRQFNLSSDEPESLGGTDTAPNPVELVLGAFTACQEIVIKAYASVLDIEVEEVKVEAKGDLDLRGFLNLSEARAGFHNIEYETTIKTDETDQGKLDQLKHFAQNRCPVLDILQNPIPVNGEISFSG